mgnify:CR=1 FL=1
MKENEFWQAAFLAMLGKEEPQNIKTSARIADSCLDEYRQRYEPEVEGDET